MNELSRFKPLDHLPLPPGVCFICSGSVGPFIDTSRQLDFEGAIYVCIGCIKEMFSQLGLESVLNADEVELQIADAANAAFEAGRQDVMRQFSEFVSTYADRSDRADANAPSVPDDNPVETSGGTPEVEPESAPSNEQGDGSFSFEESRGLSGNPSNGDSLFSFNDR